MNAAAPQSSGETPEAPAQVTAGSLEACGICGARHPGVNIYRNKAMRPVIILLPEGWDWAGLYERPMCPKHGRKDARNA